MIDYLCAKFGDFTFSRFGFIARTNRQTLTHIITDASNRVTHATDVDVSNKSSCCQRSRKTEVKRSKVKVTRPFTAETERSVSYLRNAKACELQYCYADGACYQLPRSAIKAYKVELHAGNTLSAEPGNHTTC